MTDTKEGDREMATDADDRDQVKSLLKDIYTPEQIEEWFTHPNVLLADRTPDDLLAAGERDRVLMEAFRVSLA